RRNRLEYLTGGGAAVFLLLGGILIMLGADGVPDLVVAAGFGALVIGIVAAGVRLVLAGRKTAPNMSGDSSAQLRRHLETERDLLRTAWLWYVAPLVPGFLLIYGGVWMSSPDRPAFVLIAGTLTLMFLMAVALLNRRAAAKMDRELRELARRDAGAA